MHRGEARDEANADPDDGILGGEAGSRRRGVPLKTPSLAVAHARFARAALAIYLAAAAFSVAFLLVALVTDMSHEEEQSRERLLVRTEIRAQSLSQHLGLLVDELHRLAARSELNLFDRDLAPEKSLLKLSHERSAFFNLGVAILDEGGNVLWSEPAAFVPRRKFGDERWFSGVRSKRAMRVVPVQPDRPDAVLYLVMPVLKNDAFSGALLGGIDLAKGAPLTTEPTARTILTTRDGAVVYPPVPPELASEPGWRGLFKKASTSFTRDERLGGSMSMVAAAPVAGTGLFLVSVAPHKNIFQAARARFVARLVTALVLAGLPLGVLVAMLRRSLRLFQKSEEEAVRQERFRLLGEAASSIAHEVKNALNGLSMGLDLVVRKDDRPEAATRRERVLLELRREIRRLSDFTSELMTFSKGIEPRRARVNLVSLLPSATALLCDSAAELGVEIDVVTPDEAVEVTADPALFRTVVSNLVGNALEAATGRGGEALPRVEIRLVTRGDVAELRVRDTGPGVSDAMRPLLFEPFQTEKPSGVGIGLALSRRIAEAHGGKLVLEGNGVALDREGHAGSPRFRGASFLWTMPVESA